MLPQISIPAVVTDGLWRKSLSAVRSLGKAGFEVHVMGNSLFTTSFWSKFAHRRILAPLASENPQQFGESLLKAFQDSRLKVLFPMEDASLEWAIQNRDPLEKAGFRFLAPPLYGFHAARDKGVTLSLAQDMGIPCPKTHQPENIEEFIALLTSSSEGRWIIKPRVGSGSMGFKAFQASPPEKTLRAIWDQHGSMLVQEQVPPQGRGLGVSILMNEEQECLAAFAHERLKQYPVGGGPSTDRRSIAAPGLIEKSIALLQKMNWTGVAMVEWKDDPRDGIPKLMEVNPRFWGSLELAIRAGIDFPSLYARMSLGEKIQPHWNYVAGARCRWMIPGELLRFASEPSSTREGFLDFFKGLPDLAEEWDSTDRKGALATGLCSLALAFNPRYWKFLRRG